MAQKTFLYPARDPLLNFLCGIILVSQVKMISYRMGAHPEIEHFPETPSIPKIIRVHIN